MQEVKPAQEINPPNVLWAAAITIAIALIHEYAPALPFSPVFLDAAILVLIGLLRYYFPGTKALDMALDAIDILTRGGGGKVITSKEPQFRGPNKTAEYDIVEQPLPDIVVPPRPTKNRIANAIWG